MNEGTVGQYFYGAARAYLGYIQSAERKVSVDSMPCHSLANYYLGNGACLLGDTANFLENETGVSQRDWLNPEKPIGDSSSALNAYRYTSWFLQTHLKCASYLSERSNLDEKYSQLKIEQIDRELARLNSWAELQKVFPEDVLENEPTGNYLLLDEDTKHRTRMIIEATANRSGKSVASVGAEAFSDISIFQSAVAATHTYHSVEATSRQNRWISSVSSLFIALPTAFFALSDRSNYASWVGTLLLACFTYWSIRALLDPILLIVRPTLFSVHKSDLKKTGVPPSMRIAICVSTVLTSKSEIDSLLDRTVKNIVASNDTNVCAVILFDLPDAKESGTTADEELLISHLEERIEQLLDGPLSRYGNCLSAIGRQRRYDASQSIYTGHERKRGKIDAVVKAIMGDPTGFDRDCFDWLASCETVTHIFCLDNDALLLRDCLQQLAAAAAHPLNIANGKYGHGIFMPESVANIESVTKLTNLYIRPAALSRGDRAPQRSSPYQLLNGASLYNGKALIDVRFYFSRCVDVLPPNAVLSHDTLEGLLLRPVQVPGAVILEDLPKDVVCYFERQMRWIRGDWQNIPIVISQKFYNELSLKEKGRAIRLVAWQACTSVNNGLFFPLLVYLTISGEWISIITLIATAAVTPAVLDIIGTLRTRRADRFALSMRILCALPWRAMLRIGLGPLSFYAFAEATATATWRLITKRNLLQWRPASFGATAATRLRLLAGSGTTALCSMLLAIEYKSSMGAVLLLSLSIISPLITYNVLGDKQNAPDGAEL
jgi:hypothetical protein